LASLDGGRFQFFLDLGYVAGLNVGWRGLGRIRRGIAPLRGREADAVGFLIQVSQVLVDGGIGLIAFNGLAQIISASSYSPSLK